MKKTLAAAALLAAFAGSAMADVTVYGRADVGFNAVMEGDETVFAMGSGQSSGSRVGVKGAEKVMDGVTVGFQLEAGFNVDNGTNSTYNAAKGTDGHRTFHRESRVYIATEYGTFHFGRMGTLDSGSGSVDLYGGLSAYGTGWANDMGAANFVTVKDDRRDNVVTYQSPAMAGVTVYAQVAGDAADNKAEYSHDAARYMALGAKYQAGAFGATVIYSNLEDSNDAEAGVEDRHNYTAGVNYNFGFAKAMLLANYSEQGKADSWGVVASATAPVAGGTVAGMVGYGVATDADNVDTDKFNVALTYQYPLSKSTYLYVGAGYQESEKANVVTDKTFGTFGVCHSF